MSKNHPIFYAEKCEARYISHKNFECLFCDNEKVVEIYLNLRCLIYLNGESIGCIIICKQDMGVIGEYFLDISKWNKFFKTSTT